MKSNPPKPPTEICDYENSNWRTAFWPGREYEDRAERIALAHMLPPRGERLCEIGAGFGRLAEFYLGYQRVILVDYARSMLADARERLMNDSRFTAYASRFSFVAADLYNLPLADSALDTVVTIRVLHHVADIPRAFGEIARVVRPQGAYVAEFANKRHLKAVLRYALTRRKPNPFALEPYEFVKLNFDFHPQYIADELRKNNLVIGDRRAVSMFRIAALKRIIPAKVLAVLDGVLQSPLSRFSISPSMFLRTQSTKLGAPTLDAELWRCPACKSTEIGESAVRLSCHACGRIYPIVDGIIDFKSQM